MLNLIEFGVKDPDPQFPNTEPKHRVGELECNKKHVTSAAILIAPLLSTSVRLNGGTTGGDKWKEYLAQILILSLYKTYTNINLSLYRTYTNQK